MKHGMMAGCLALLLAAAMPAAGLADEAGKPTADPSGGELLIPADVTRVELEGPLMQVDAKTGTFVVNEKRVQWDGNTRLLDARGEPMKADALREGMKARVEAAEVIGGYFALTVRAMAR
jgi:hypothetical protein